MNIDKQIKEWAEQIRESVEQSGSELMNQITGRYMDMGDDNDTFLMPNFNVKTLKWNVLAIARNYQTNKIFDADLYTEKEFDSIEEAVEYIREKEHDDYLEKDIDESSENYLKAKKIGYLGDDKEEKVEEWLNSAWAKWSQHCLDVFTRVAGGDEQKGLELFNEYENIGSIAGFASRWSAEEKRYMKPQEFLEKFEKKVPVDDPEVKDLLQKLEKKWNADNKGVAEYYATSDSRGGYTGD